MARYIDADALKDRVDRMWDSRQLTNTKHKTIIELLDGEPTADVRENVRGKWLWGLAENGWANHVCSNCGWTKNTDVHVMLGYDYCPNCGAEMSGGEKYVR